MNFVWLCVGLGVSSIVFFFYCNFLSLAQNYYYDSTITAVTRNSHMKYSKSVRYRAFDYHNSLMLLVGIYQIIILTPMNKYCILISSDAFILSVASDRITIARNQSKQCKLQFIVLKIKFMTIYFLHSKNISTFPWTWYFVLEIVIFELGICVKTNCFMRWRQQIITQLIAFAHTKWKKKKIFISKSKDQPNGSKKNNY